MHVMHNVVWHQSAVTRERRELLDGHRACAVWFAGFSGSGKSTLAHGVEEQLHGMKYRTFVFDGDNVRHGLCSDLGFSIEDRNENLRRIAEMVKLFLEAGGIALCAFISPLRADREKVSAIVGGVIAFWKYTVIVPWKSVNSGMSRDYIKRPGRA